MPDPATATRTWTVADFAAAPSIVDLDPDSPTLGSQARFEKVTARSVLAAGVAKDDLTAFAAACTKGSEWDPDYAAMALISHLTKLTDVETHDDLPLRDAIAWCMVATQENWATTFAIDEFTEVGLRVDGWRFLAAGIEPVEAAILLDTHDDVPHETLATMVALRGTRLLPTHG